MIRLTIWVAAIASLLVGPMNQPVAAQSVFAPPYYVQPRQPLSPYLNFLRGGNPAVNYYLGVLPELQKRRGEPDRFAIPEAISRRRTGIDDLDDTLPTLPETGHPVRFLNYGPFYNLGSSPPANSLYPQRPRNPR